MNKHTLILGAVLSAIAAPNAMADVALAVRAGTFGYGADVDFGLTDTVTLRLGYNTLNYSRTLEDTDVTYDGTLKVGAASAIFDWHVLGGGFRLSAGAVQKGPSIEVVGVPTGNSYEINGTTYTAAEIGSLSGTIKMGGSTAPYVGIGWGNTVDDSERLTFLLDVGALNTGSPKATLNVVCGASVPTPTCDQIRSDVNAEKVRLEDEASSYEWYPVISLGVAYRF